MQLTAGNFEGMGAKEFMRQFSYYSLDSMLSLCASCEDLSVPNGKLCDEITGEIVLPWELATFAMLALLSKRHEKTKMTNERFKDAVNFIRHRGFPKVNDYNKAVERISYQLAPVQFQYQVNPFLRMLRFDFIYRFKNEKLSMPDEFRKKFGVKVEDVLNFLYFVLVVSFGGRTVLSFIHEIEKVGARMPEAVLSVLKLVTLKMDDFQLKQRRLIQASEASWMTAPNLLEVYPVIRKCGRLYVPFSFLLNGALTFHLLDRLTRDNLELRRRVGKEALESYEAYLFDCAGCYAKVKREHVYKGRDKTQVLTPDVIVEDNGYLLFVDSKSSEPGLGLRGLKGDAKQEAVRIYADHFVKMCKRIKDVADGFDQSLKYERAHIFGIVTVFRDSNVERAAVRAAGFARMRGMTDMEIGYYTRHVFLFGLDQVELFCCYGVNLLPQLIELSKQDESPNSIILDMEELKGRQFVPAVRALMNSYAETFQDGLFGF